MASLGFNAAGFNQLVNIVEQLAQIVEEQQAGATSTSKNTGATPRVKSVALEAFAKANPGLIGDDAPEVDGYLGTTDIFVYEVDGDLSSAHLCNRTGLPGFWVQSKKGKRFLVDVQGVPFFLYNPLREKAYADLGVEAQEV